MIDPSGAITMETRLIANPAMVLREEDEGDYAILYDPRSGAVRIMNRSAVGVWRLLDGRRSLAEVVEALRQDFEGMDDAAGEQVLRVCRKLYAMGAVGTVATQDD